LSLQTRLALTVMATLSVPLTVAAILLALVLPAQLTRHTDREVLASRDAVHVVLIEQCDSLQAYARLLGFQATVSGLTDSTVKSITLGGTNPGTGTIGVVALVKPNGKVAAIQSRPPEGFTLAAAKVATDGMDCAAGSTGEALLARQRIQRVDGTLLGTAVVATWLDDATMRIWRQALRLDGLSATGPDQPLANLGANVTAAARAGQAAAANGSVQHAGDVRISALTLRAPFGAGTALVAVALTASEYAWLPWALALAVIAVVGLSGLLSREIARAAMSPLDELATAAGRVALGDFDVRTPVRSRDEVGRLAATFNAMTKALQTYVEALDRKEIELHRDLARVGETLSGTHDLDRISTVALTTAMSNVDASAGAVFLLDEDHPDQLVVAHQRGAASWQLVSPEQAGSPVYRALAEHRVLAGQVGIDEGFDHFTGAATGTYVLCAPIGVPERPYGVLCLYDPATGGGFTARDVQVIEAFATQTSAAVENVLLHREAERLSITDGLTGLWNYRYLTHALGREIERAERFQRPLALLVLDLDHFKAVNDAHGHPRGDAVLIELAQRLRAQIREIDVLARYGGEEFVLLLPETELVGAEQLAVRILAAVRDVPFGLMAKDTPTSLTLTGSIGLAVLAPGTSMDPQGLLHTADAALYRAKHAGRDCYRIARRSDGQEPGVPGEATTTSG
jgi:two-component system cell cycle response regulator